MKPSPLLTTDDIRVALTTVYLGRRLFVHRELSSTNEEAMALAQGGAEHGTVVVADSQTAGRGRHGRTWFSPPAQNLYCSVLVRTAQDPAPVLPAERLSWVPLAAALAAADAVHATTAVSLSLKWPNDLLLDDRKAGGILCESGSIGTSGAFVVIGLGLNANVERHAFPPDLYAIAASLSEQTSQAVDRNRLLARWLDKLEQRLDALATGSSRQLHADYTARCSTIGRRVQVHLGGGQHLVGTAQGIGPDGALQLSPDDSSPSRVLLNIRAADVIHLRE